MNACNEIRTSSKMQGKAGTSEEEREQESRDSFMSFLCYAQTNGRQ